MRASFETRISASILIAAEAKVAVHVQFFLPFVALMSLGFINTGVSQRVFDLDLGVRFPAHVCGPLFFGRSGLPSILSIVGHVRDAHGMF